MVGTLCGTNPIVSTAKGPVRRDSVTKVPVSWALAVGFSWAPEGPREDISRQPEKAGESSSGLPHSSPSPAVPGWRISGWSLGSNNGDSGGGEGRSRTRRGLIPFPEPPTLGSFFRNISAKGTCLSFLSAFPSSWGWVPSNWRT